METTSEPCKTVVVVEDDADIRDTFQQLLEMEGYTVRTASNGKEGLAVIREEKHPCMVILDLMMPIMNGWEFLKEQKADPELASIPVVVVTAAGRRDVEINLPAKAVLKKPIELDTLVGVVKQYCH